jgi:hypothetical protein
MAVDEIHLPTQPSEVRRGLAVVCGLPAVIFTAVGIVGFAKVEDGIGARGGSGTPPPMYSPDSISAPLALALW